MSLGVVTWVGGMITNKPLIFLSMTSAVASILPPKLAPYLEDIMFVLIGWMVALLLSFFELKTSTARGKTGKQKARMLTYYKFIIYTFLFFSLKLFHLWILFDDHIMIGTVINVLVIFVYILVVLSEFKLIGNNLEKRYETKPKVFTYMDSFEKWILRYIVKRAEAVCNVEAPEKEKKVTEE